jgi:hypothetical protein
MGETQLYSKRQTENGIFWGIPLAQHKKALELLQLDDLPREDMRKKIPFPQKLKFTGKLHDGTAKNTINQVRAVDLFWERIIETGKNFGIIEAAPRSGKSYMATNIICDIGYRAFITCSEVAWLEQFLDAFLEVTNVAQLKDAVWLISGKASSRKYDKIVPGIRVVSNLAKVPPEACIVLAPYQYFIHDHARIIKMLHNKFTTLVVDECHKGAAAEFSTVLNNLDVSYGIGLSGTVDRNDGQSAIVRRVLGSIAVKVDAKIFPPKFFLYETGVNVNAANPTTRVTALCRSDKRNKQIVDQVFKDLEAHENNCILIPVSRLNHMHRLARMINDRANMENHVAHANARKQRKIPKDIWPFPLAMTYSGKTKDHGYVRQQAAKRRIRVTVAYISKVSHGLSVASWNYVYTGLAPISSGPNFYQLVSRVSTPPKKGEDKMQPVVRHFVDGYPESAISFKNLWQSEYKSLRYLIEEGKIKVDDATYERMVDIIDKCGSYSGPQGIGKQFKSHTKASTVGGFKGLLKRK